VFWQRESKKKKREKEEPVTRPAASAATVSPMQPSEKAKQGPKSERRRSLGHLATPCLSLTGRFPLQAASTPRRSPRIAPQSAAASPSSDEEAAPKKLKKDKKDKKGKIASKKVLASLPSPHRPTTLPPPRCVVPGCVLDRAQWYGSYRSRLVS